MTRRFRGRAAAALLAASVSAVHAEPPAPFAPRESAVRVSYGIADRASLRFYTLGAHAAFDLPEVVPPIAGNRIRIALELLGSVIEDHQSAAEVALSPLIFDYRYDRGGRVVPFVEGGEGVVLNWLHGLDLGGPFEFSSQAGGGIHLFVNRTDALTIDFRIRHISNAGIRSPNRGLNTYFLTLGWSRFPSRP